MTQLEKLAMAMIDYYSGDAKRAQHFLKVHAFSKLIGAGEGIDEKTMFTLEAAAYVHDIGIKAAEEKYGYQNGKLQEELGPPIAEKMLTELGFEKDVIDRVCYLIAHHHTYKDVDGIDYRILLEADFLVNFYEFKIDSRVMYAAKENIFETETGRKICETMFPGE